MTVPLGQQSHQLVRDDQPDKCSLSKTLVLLIGSTGSGKTALLKVITGQGPGGQAGAASVTKGVHFYENADDPQQLYADSQGFNDSDHKTDESTMDDILQCCKKAKVGKIKAIVMTSTMTTRGSAQMQQYFDFARDLAADAVMAINMGSKLPPFGDNIKIPMLAALCLDLEEDEEERLKMGFAIAGYENMGQDPTKKGLFKTQELYRDKVLEMLDSFEAQDLDYGFVKCTACSFRGTRYDNCLCHTVKDLVHGELLHKHTTEDKLHPSTQRVHRGLLREHCKAQGMHQKLCSSHGKVFRKHGSTRMGHSDTYFKHARIKREHPDFKYIHPGSRITIEVDRETAYQEINRKGGAMFLWYLHPASHIYQMALPKKREEEVWSCCKSDSDGCKKICTSCEGTHASSGCLASCYDCGRSPESTGCLEICSKCAKRKSTAGCTTFCISCGCQSSSPGCADYCASCQRPTDTEPCLLVCKSCEKSAPLSAKTIPGGCSEICNACGQDWASIGCQELCGACGQSSDSIGCKKICSVCQNLSSTVGCRSICNGCHQEWSSLGCIRYCAKCKKPATEQGCMGVCRHCLQPWGTNICTRNPQLGA